MTSHAGHIVLLGDSIFDNGAYTRGAPDVVTHLQRLLPRSWTATSCAVDGATTGSVGSQLACIPGDATHLVVSIGGNDALQSIDLLSWPVTSMSEALEILAGRIDAFERCYRSTIRNVMALERQTAVCTVYNGALDPDIAIAARTGLAVFNDVILRTAVELNLRALELRSVCTERSDYADAIEPSSKGGSKIAAAIARMLTGRAG